MGIAQEGIHSIKLKENPIIVLKLNLQEEYDRVNRNFLRLVLLQVGLNLNITNWITSCVDIASFAIIINDGAPNFFKPPTCIR